MTTTITIDAVDHVPILVDGYSANRASQSVEHGTVAVILRPAAPRAGRLRALFADESDALALLDGLSLGLVGDLASSERPGIDMTFYLAADGEAAISLDPDTRDHWWVEFDYKEMPA